jgi:hypothetical protein
MSGTSSLMRGFWLCVGVSRPLPSQRGQYTSISVEQGGAETQPLPLHVLQGCLSVIASPIGQ